MSTSPDPGPVNGHTSPSPDERSTRIAEAAQSNSHLSDTQPSGADGASPGSADDAGSAEDEPEFVPEEDQDDASQSSEQDAPDDADFNGEDSPASAQSNDASDRPVTVSTAPKRKAANILDDEYIRENPELYGLRRSVRYLPSCLRYPFGS